MKNLLYPFFTTLLLFNCSPSEALQVENDIAITNNPTIESIYFPPINTNEWETVSPESLNWSTENLTDLYTFLEEKNSKSFIVLHNGKIVIERYMNGHTETSPWYWASAGKTLTSTITGIAQDQGLININNKVSDYLWTGWTSLPTNKEDLITCKNLLNMTSGLDDGLGDDLSVANLQYVADANSRWAYHNVYVKLQEVISQASNETWDSYFESRLKSKIGMTGAWIANNNLNVFWSKSRSMARFGLMISAKGKWNSEQIVSENFLNSAISSQPINDAYGYLWWLNGKESFHLPQSQFEFSGQLIENAPSDMYCALGKNDQKIYIVPNKNIVIIRMGEAGDSSSFGLSTFDTDLWEKINAVIN